MFDYRRVKILQKFPVKILMENEVTSRKHWSCQHYLWGLDHSFAAIQLEHRLCIDLQWLAIFYVTFLVS